MADPDMRNDTCKWCGEKTLIFRDNQLCDDCDSRTVYCCVCRSRKSEESRCRHVFYAIDHGWTGAGVYPSGDSDMKRPVMRLLSALGEDFARELREAIRQRKFYTWIVAPMIGGGGILDLGGMHHRWGDQVIALGQSERAEELHDGFCWLQSLYKGNTTKANRATIGWINEWLWPFTPSLISSTEREHG